MQKAGPEPGSASAAGMVMFLLDKANWCEAGDMPPSTDIYPKFVHRNSEAIVQGMEVE